LGNLHGFDPDKDEVSYDKLLDIDQWALAKLSETAKKAQENFNAYEFAKVTKMIYAFCNEDLSGFYLDILKDRLYTSASFSCERRSAQTVLFHILNHLVRLLAPVLTFSADEIFSLMPRSKAMKEIDNVHLLEWLSVPDVWDNKKIREKFAPLEEMRPFVMKALEDKRRDNEIGSSLEAKVTFQSSDPKDIAYLESIQAILPSTFIVSQVGIEHVEKISQGLNDQFSKLAVSVKKADGEKCPRCWNYRLLGEDQDHPTICTRCALAVKEMGFKTASSVSE